MELVEEWGFEERKMRERYDICSPGLSNANKTTFVARLMVLVEMIGVNVQ